jgi:hypothetical protein
MYDPKAANHGTFNSYYDDLTETKLPAQVAKWSGVAASVPRICQAAEGKEDPVWEKGMYHSSKGTLFLTLAILIYDG